MTSHQVNDLASSFVAMAQAFEKLPQVEAALDDARVSIDAQAATIQRLELKLIERANEIAEVQAKLRKSEEDRESAEAMFLEADDKLGKFATLAKNALGLVTPEPVVTPQPEPQPEASGAPIAGNGNADPGERAVDPSVTPTTPVMDDAHTSSSAPVSASPEPAPAPEVAVPTDPTAPSTAGDGPSPETAEATSGVASTPDAGSPPSAEPFSMQPAVPQPYAGKRWTEVCSGNSAYVSHSEWLAGGGSEEGWCS